MDRQIYLDDEEEAEEAPEAAQKNERFEFLVQQKLSQKRIVFLCEAVTSESARRVIKELLYHEMQAPGVPIVLVINSPGGSVTDGMAIYDVVKALASPVITLVMGMAASMGSLLSLVAVKGARLAFPNARIMVHQPLIHGRVQGVVTDVEIHAREILKTKKALRDIYVESTGKPADEIEKIIDRDTWFSANEALEYGLLDAVIHSMKDLDAHIAKVK